MEIGIFMMLAVVLAIAATVLAFVFLVPDKKREKLNGFGKFIHDTLNFKYLIIEKILQALYIFFTAFVILVGFFMLFYVQRGYSGFYYTPSVWYGGYGLLVMILGPIIVRIAYEFSMMLVLLIKNVIQINNKLKASGDGKEDIFAAPSKATYEAPVAPAAPAAPAEPKAKNKFCVYCGAKMGETDVCAQCGRAN